MMIMIMNINSVIYEHFICFWGSVNFFGITIFYDFVLCYGMTLQST